MGSRLGAAKTAAARVGLTIEQYEANVAQGLRWCAGCKLWHPAHQFTTDLSRSGGLACTCRAWRNANIARSPEPVEKRRARRLVQMRVRRGRLPHPATLPCVKCGDIGTSKRHEYHHHNGYDLAHRADVVPMCSTCHSQEEK